MNRAHVYRQPGPGLDAPFTVVKGLVAVLGDVNLALTPGATWPGLSALPEWLWEITQPDTTEIVAGTVVHAHPPTPREIESGLALIHAQLLHNARLPLPARLRLLAQTVDVADVNLDTAAALVAGVRPSISKLL